MRLSRLRVATRGSFPLLLGGFLTGFIGAAGAAALGLLFVGARYASAHCDGLDGPVVKAAQKALATNNVNLVLIWSRRRTSRS